VVLVGVHCPLQELERREQERGDRAPGLAARQICSNCSPPTPCTRCMGAICAVTRRSARHSTPAPAPR
jgi:chloramphenicol 3-O-phosphotransferase